MNELEAVRKQIKAKQRSLQRIEDSKYREKHLKYSRDWYAKPLNRKNSIASSLKWNQLNRERKNANNCASYARNKDKILAKQREKRRIKREANQ